MTSETSKTLTPPEAVITRFVDFWLLGGASIALWLIMSVGQLARDHSEIIENHFIQVGAVFSILLIFCNHPHFMMSYRIGYGRGFRFITRHWFSLLAIPLGLVALYALAYFNFDIQISDRPWVLTLNHFFEQLGLAFRLGTLPNLGTEILSLSILLLNITVGWHYSKQVFGCVMVYAHYDRYPISRIQRLLIKISLFSVAFYNFFYMAIEASVSDANPLNKSYFFNIPIISLGLPKFLLPLTATLVALSAFAVISFVFFTNFKRARKLPSLNLLVPWVAFHVWWIPFFRQPEFYFMVIPFFHSLQYLPFAYRLESPKVKRGKGRELSLTLRLAILLLVGFSFELIPNMVDQGLETNWYLKTWFFTIAFAVFINVHHFFIDSVVWKFDQSDVRDHLLTNQA